MEDITKEILICLIAAHFLGDFIFQTDEEASQKKRIPILLKHAGLVAALGYLLLGIWDLWQIPLIIFITHGLLDYIKASLKKESVYSFLIDQALHLIVILFVSILVTPKIIILGEQSLLWTLLWGNIFIKLLILITGITVSVKAGGILIGLAVKPFTDQIQKDDFRGGLERGGKVIGYLERSLIFLFVLMDYVAGIGFLIAAKSVLRFGEVKERENWMRAEYIIIGTLMSYGYGVFIAYLTKTLIELF